ncbi:MAG: M23 family metallopeptidase [Caldilineales bacterium]|nr:M23 family metallopeptidase [Caldilineales bacterium]
MSESKFSTRDNRLPSASRPTNRRKFLLLAVLIALALLASACAEARTELGESASRLMRLRAWFGDPSAHPEWLVNAGERCGDAAMIMPTSGYIGVGWGDSFRPGHNHSGYDIFTPERANNITPIVAARDGYLTRESTWRSAVIIRHPNFPRPGDVLWTYYTHMASADGETSFIAPEFPSGTHEVFVKAGTLLGYQGNWSGVANAPTGVHLHFSVVKSTGSGYANETIIENTFDPGPFLGIETGPDGFLVCAQTSSQENPEP